MLYYNKRPNQKKKKKKMKPQGAYSIFLRIFPIVSTPTAAFAEEARLGTKEGRLAPVTNQSPAPLVSMTG